MLFQAFLGLKYSNYVLEIVVSMQRGEILQLKTTKHRLINLQNGICHFRKRTTLGPIDVVPLVASVSIQTVMHSGIFFHYLAKNVVEGILMTCGEDLYCDQQEKIKNDSEK